MFDMEYPWWEFIVRATAVYLSLLVMVRITGKRTIGQFTPFDLIVVMLLSEAASGSLNGQDSSLPGGLIGAATLIALNVLIATITSRNQRIDYLVQGKPILVGRDGTVYKDILDRERVSESDFNQALREHDCAIEDMRMAVLESDGKISILKREKPVTVSTGA